MKFDSRYGEYFRYYCNYFGRPLRLKKLMYEMNNSGKLFADEITNFMMDEEGFKQSKFKMSIFYKYAPYGSKLVVLYYVYDCVYWYTYEELVNRFVDKLGKISHLNFLVYARCFMSISISQLKEHSISLCQAKYSTSVVINIYTLPQ